MEGPVGQGPAAEERRAGQSRFYAIYVTGGYEEKVAVVLAERARALKLDVRSIVASKDLKGVIFVEVGNVSDLYYLIRGVRNIKRKRPLQVSIDDVAKLVTPPAVAEEIQRGQIVLVIGGPFKGMRGKVVDVRRGEVDITLLEGDSKIVVTIPIDQVKPETEKQS